MLQHSRFESIFPSVYRVRGLELTSRQWIDAARRALPPDARLSHATALWSLGLELGQLKPMHFTVARDLHLAIDDVMLHRTEVMPPSDDQTVSVVAAFVGAAATMRLIDVIAAGDWLLNRGYLTKASVAGFIERVASSLPGRARRAGSSATSRWGDRRILAAGRATRVALAGCWLSPRRRA